MLFAALVLLAASAVALALGDLAFGQAAGPAAKDRVVAATVNDEPLYVDQIEQQLRKTLGGSLPAEPLRPRAMAQMLEQSIRQRLVEEFLARGTTAMSVRDLDALVESLVEQTKKKGQPFQEYLAEQGLTERTLRKRWAWTLGWGKYLEAQATDERLAALFKMHRSQMDGTQIRVAQLLVKIDDPRNPERVKAAVERAGQIRKLIMEGKLTFADAVRDYSQAPSSDSGGDLGFVTPAELPEGTGVALAKLAPQEITEPLVTPFGVHLMTITETKPGTKTWQECREPLKKILATELFAEIAARERKSAKVEYTDAIKPLASEGASQ